MDEKREMLSIRCDRRRGHCSSRESLPPPLLEKCRRVAASCHRTVYHSALAFRSTGDSSLELRKTLMLRS